MITYDLVLKSDTLSGLPHGQEKMGVFEKSQEKTIQKHHILSVQVYKFLIFKSLRLVKNSLKIF